MWSRIQEEPVAIQGLLQAAIAVATSFGLHLTSTQIGTLSALSTAILAFVTRQIVTPAINPKTNQGRKLIPQS